MSKPGLQIDNDWTVGDLRDQRECIIGIVACIVGAVGQARVESGGPLRQRSDSLAQLIHRQTSEIDELHALVDCRKLIPVGTSKGLLSRRITDNRNLLESRNERSCGGKRLPYGSVNRRSGYMRRELQLSHRSVMKTGQDDRYVRIQLGS